VDFAGEFFTVEAAGVGFLPGRRLDLWLGGSAPAGLRRVGRLADGWLGSLLTPGEAGAVVGTIRRAADEAGRAIEEDHYGLSLPVAFESPMSRCWRASASGVRTPIWTSCSLAAGPRRVR
jgi:alkanesulfonate monooxygenase SsuD/methylene tetrahydromethanopterin reductase-like flavin-dependent oxidoreductase (luciferase family)